LLRSEQKKYVLRLALYLVEKRFFKKVEIFFYVREHTKNAFDHMFNQLKLDFHKRNIHAFGQIMNFLNTQPHAMAYDYPTDKFYAYSEMFGTFYRPISAGLIHKNHMFWVEQSTCNELLLCTKLHPDAPAETQSMALMTSGPVGKDYKLKVLDVPGVKDIKQVELYTDWRPFMYTQYNDSMCRRPNDEVLLCQKAVKVGKAKVIRDKKLKHEEEEGDKKTAAKKTKSAPDAALMTPKEKAVVAPKKKATTVEAAAPKKKAVMVPNDNSTAALKKKAIMVASLALKKNVEMGPKEKATAALNKKAAEVPKEKATTVKAGEATAKPKRGRPKGSKNKQKYATT
jgi:hypothetical protein